MKIGIDSNGKDSAIIIMPRCSKSWMGAEALWITAAGWAGAAQRRLGKSWVVTSDRISSPFEVIDFPIIATKGVGEGSSSGKRHIPFFIKIIVKDLLLWGKSLKFAFPKTPPWSNSKVSFIWQQHDLFPGPGRRLADRLGVPLVTYVHAPVVWETSKWGVKRYMWGSFLERFSEASALRQSDLVLCVSEEVAEKLVSMGVAKSRISVSPMAVDPYLFADVAKKQALKDSLGLTGKYILGWAGSFRTFHGLDLLIKCFQLVKERNPNVCLLLVGDGSEREKIEKLVCQLALQDSVVFAGRQPFSKIPSFISIFDMAIVSANNASGFHYSPLKLREYMVAGKPTLAPFAGDLPTEFGNEEELLFYPVGNINKMAQQIDRIINDQELCHKLSIAGKKAVMESGTWDYELEKILKNG